MPINIARFVNSAWTRGCDGFTLDLQDSVPQAQKAYARTLVPDAIQIVAQGGGEVQVRINQAFIEADVAAAVWPGLSSLNMGHTLNVEQVHLMDACVSRIERERGLRAGTIEVDVSPDEPSGLASPHPVSVRSAKKSRCGGESASISFVTSSSERTRRGSPSSDRGFSLAESARTGLAPECPRWRLA